MELARLNGHLQCLEAIDADGQGLRVVFFWHGDRYAHRIELPNGNEPLLIVESDEGSDQEEWPLSSPLQQLSIESRPDNRTVALLVGMAGQSHWSASITADSNDRSLLFEMACRTKDSAASLSDSYHINSNPQPIVANDNHVRWPQFALSSTSASIRLAPSGDSLQIRARTDKVAGLTTIQWSYEWKAIDN